MVYEVWNAETANIVGAFDSEADALSAIGRVIEEHGPAYVASLILGVEDDDGESTLIAEGVDLVERVRAHQGREPAAPAIRAIGVSD